LNRNISQRRHAKLLAVLASLLLVAFAAGCGGGDDDGNDTSADEAAVRAVLDDHVAAAQGNDATAYCATLTEEVRYQIAMASAMQIAGKNGKNSDKVDTSEITCEKVMGKMLEAGLAEATKPIEVTTVEVNGDEASVGTKSGVMFTLAKDRDGSWKVSQGRSAEESGKSDGESPGEGGGSASSAQP